MINIDQISFSYPRKRIFNDFSLKLDGRIIGLIGKNGAGKSTLVQLMTGLRRVKSGDIYIDDINVRTHRKTNLRNMGVMFEDSEFPPWATLREHLRFVGQLRGMKPSEAEEEGIDILNRFGIGDKVDEKFQNLSAGMKQKFGIAQALIGSPKYVILDEPTANLDVGARILALEYFQDLAYEKDMRFVILSHILHDLEKVCDEIAIIDDGNLIHQSSMSEIMDNYIVKEYSIRLKDSESCDEVEKLVSSKGMKTSRRGLTLKVTIHNSEELDSLRPLVPSQLIPVRSVLEQLFIDSVGVDID